MSYAKDYGHGGTMSSQGDKEKYHRGAEYVKNKRNPYMRDMYDDMKSLRPQGPTSATGKPNGGIQGNVAKGMEGSTQDKSMSQSPKMSGQDHYGYGNPYEQAGPGKGAKPDNSAKPVSEKKQVAQPGKKKWKPKSLADLREMAKEYS